MIDWSKYSTKPEADTIQNYPTIVDVIEDILEYEEQHLKLTKFPLSDNRTWLYDMEEPGHYIVMSQNKGSEEAVLYPTGRNPMTFYRGESRYHETCVPSLLRVNDEKVVLQARLQTAELECILSQHPVVKDFLLREIRHRRLSRPFYLKVPFVGLAQHYGILTPYIDLTNDKWVAAFFAITNFISGKWEVVLPSDIQQYGSIYRLADFNFNDHSLPHPKPIGLQYFNRPGRQSAFTLDIENVRDFNKYPNVERIYFRHDAEANCLVYDLCLQGRRFLPEDSLVELVDELKKTTQFSKGAVEKARMAYYVSKSSNEMQSYLQSYGFEEVSLPVVGFDKQQMCSEKDEWQSEGAARFLNTLMVIPVGKFEL